MSFWKNDKHVERLKDLWPQGLSAAQVAAILAQEFPDAAYTRSAIIGKAHRLGLTKRPKDVYIMAQRVEARRLASVASPREQRTFSRIALTPAVSPVIPSTAAPVAPPARMADEPGAHAATLANLGAHQCRWPLGPALATPHLFCGEPLDEDRDLNLPAYCPAHMGRAFAPPRPGKPRRSASELARSLRRYVG